MTISRREAALNLSEELLDDIELSRIAAPELLKKVSRLARILDDTDALDWLAFEMNGYPIPLPSPASQAARRSRRHYVDEKGVERVRVSSLSRIQAEIDLGAVQIAAAVDRNVSISSANPSQTVFAPTNNANERRQLRAHVVTQSELLGKVMGSMHTYVSERQVELRFGAAVESALTIVRNSVDSRIARLAPAAATKLAAAFENASSGDPEQWANAAAACRRLLKAIADELRPAGEPVGGRVMTDDKYINRLIDWISGQSVGGTLEDIITADLDDLGHRIDAFDDAGHKGAHADVTQYEASRFITGTYLLVGDILSLWAAVSVVEGTPATGSADELSGQGREVAAATDALQEINGAEPSINELGTTR